jgi:hypothetical protein
MSNITNLLTIQNQIRVFHFQTSKYNHHVASGIAYDKLDKLIDSYIEEFSGKYSPVLNTGGFNISLKNITEFDINEFIKLSIEYLNTELTADLNASDANLMNIRDEMVGVIRKFQYLISLQ